MKSLVDLSDLQALLQVPLQQGCENHHFLGLKNGNETSPGLIHELMLFHELAHVVQQVVPGHFHVFENRVKFVEMRLEMTRNVDVDHPNSSQERTRRSTTSSVILPIPTLDLCGCLGLPMDRYVFAPAIILGHVDCSKVVT